ncbi:MAG TPA: hypothetical protein VFD87_09855 [Phototrophicaceae bacterium]|nr:hypothetical protein [Phototrophicaceae bacterium]
MRVRNFGISIIVSLFLCMNFLIFARPPKQGRTLLINGYSGELPILEKDGVLYVAVNALVKLTNASIAYRGNQVVLTLPSGPPDSQAITRQGTRSDFSRAFLTAAIEQMAVIREWRSTLAMAVQRGYPITDDWTNPLSDKAQTNLALVSAALSTDSDRSAYDLLANEYNYMNRLTEQFLDANRSRTYIRTDSLENDPLNRQILACAQSLEAMAASGKFVDDGLCH